MEGISIVLLSNLIGMKKFYRLTKKKTPEQLDMSLLCAKLSGWALLSATYDGGESCPPEEVGSICKFECFEVFTN